MTLHLPRVVPLNHVLDQVNLEDEVYFVSVDDEAAVHQAWTARLQAVGFDSSGRHVIVTSISEVEAWLLRNGSKKALYLMDLVFSGESEDGLEAISRLGIKDRAVLVTFQHDDPVVLKRAANLGIKVLAKNLIEYVPIRFRER